MLLISLSNVGVVDLEVCCPIFGIFHFAPRYFNIIDRSKLSVGRVPNCCFSKRGQFLLQFFSLIISVFCYCNKVGSLKRISVLLTYLSNFRLFTEILFSYGFFFPFFLLLKDSFKIIFSQHAIGAYFGFLNYPRILCTSGSFSFHLLGALFFFLFFFAFLSVYSGGERGGNFAISEETLNMFNIFFVHTNYLLRGVTTMLVAFSSR